MSNQNTPKTKPAAKAKRWSLIASAAVATTLVTAGLTGSAASATLDGGGFCIQAKGFENAFTGKAGAACAVAADPRLSWITRVEVLASLKGGTYALWATDLSTRVSKQVNGGTSSGFGASYLPVSKKGWTFEARSVDTGTTVARGSLGFDEIKDNGRGMWEGALVLQNSPIEQRLDFSFTPDRGLPINGVPRTEPFTWEVRSAAGELKARGEATTNSGGTVRVPGNAVSLTPKTGGQFSGSDLEGWTATTVWRGKSETLPAFATWG